MRGCVRVWSANHWASVRDDPGGCEALEPRGEGNRDLDARIGEQPGQDLGADVRTEGAVASDVVVAVQLPGSVGGGGAPGGCQWPGSVAWAGPQSADASQKDIDAVNNSQALAQRLEAERAAESARRAEAKLIKS